LSAIQGYPAIVRYPRFWGGTPQVHHQNSSIPPATCRFAIAACPRPGLLRFSYEIAATTLADADFGYFDENQDGEITRKEFVDKASAFFLRFDGNGDCRVTPDEIRAAAAPKDRPLRKF